MKGRVSVTLWITVLVVALVLGTFGVHAQRPRRGAGGMARMACNIEGLWAEVAFTANVADETLLKIRPDFQEAWDARNEVSAEITSREDIISNLGELADTFIVLRDAVKKGLTDEEFGKLSEWLEQQESMLEMMRERMSGSGGFGGARRQPEE